MSDIYSLQVNSETFETEVLQKSHQKPVVVDFYAEWCGPCKSLGPTLEKLADEYDGAFILAKVDADAEQMLVASMGVRSLPTVVLFKDGQPIDHFMGALPEGEIRTILNKYVERAEKSLTERAKNMIESGQFDEAIALYQLITADDPENYDAFLDMAQALLKNGNLDEAEAIIERLPDSYMSDTRAKAITAGKVFKNLLLNGPDRKTCEARLADSAMDSEAQYFLAVHLIVADEIDRAITELLALVRHDRQFKDDGARQLLIRLFDRLGADDPLTRHGRKQLAAILMV